MLPICKFSNGIGCLLKKHIRAIQLDPNDGRAHGWYSYMLVSLRRHEEAIREAKREADLSPLGSVDVAAPGVARLLAGQTEGVIESIQNGVDLDSTVWLVQMQMGWAHEIKKEWNQAIRSYERAARLAGPTLIPRADVARLYALAGRTVEAREMLAELRAEAVRSGVYLPQISTIHARAGRARV